ncbi:two-partner secretion domain-containing protein [Oxynema aestuarii]|uniref:Filamentous hemagglutinin N-terminal domain-containing protein n=1 Tax=Oxynema aestuarii AP17 TaxID=2064643 RepID=A0A6H1U207_9CYAN|nr:filamentous hemagglutinin N-terminal domain-containing protein [Oxynema aestuarii]QIZ72861.1 filamentous hemagglutinin N-terminal domain-containing protein [Oxynema aestuarii AP17]
MERQHPDRNSNPISDRNKINLLPKHRLKNYLLPIFFTSFIYPAQAQIVPDRTLPVNSSVTRQGNLYEIEGGTQAETNLFHSFEDFSLPTNGEAFFNNALEIENIFTRVTGRSPSNIDGLIRANGVANLFILNPNGIVFGPNAQLDLGGSFLASSANRIDFADGTSFSTLASETPPILTVSVPVGLQMGSNPGSIVVNGPGNNLSRDSETNGIVRDNRSPGLQVNDRTIALLGGGIELSGGNITSNGGSIELGSVGDRSRITLSKIEENWAFDYSEIADFREIQLKAAASLDSSGEGAGAIHLQGRTVSLSEGSAILGLTLGNRAGGDLLVRSSESLQLSGFNNFGFPSVLVTLVEPQATANGGDLTVETRQLTLADGTAISASTLGRGNGGNLTVFASQSVELKGLDPSGLGSFLETSVAPQATGHAGDLTIATTELTLSDGAIVFSSTSGQGNGGNLSVLASESVELKGLDDFGFSSSLRTNTTSSTLGHAGDLAIETTELILADGAMISAATSGNGDGGNLSIVASESVELRGLDGSGFGSSVLSSVTSEASGNAGNITVETRHLSLADGAGISTSTLSRGQGGDLTAIASDSVILSGFNGSGQPSFLSTDVGSEATGDAGDLAIETARLSLFDGARISSSTFGRGNGGTLTAIASDSIELSGLDTSGKGSILRTSVGLNATGDAGNLAIETARLSLSDGAAISTSTLGEGNGGNVTILASESAILKGFNRSGLATSILTLVGPDVSGNAGSVTLETQRLSLFDGAGISTSTLGRGNGGNLTILASEFVSLNGFNASGVSSALATDVGPEATGNAGNLTVQTGKLTLADGALISAATLGGGNGGNLTLMASESIALNDSSGSGVGSVVVTLVGSQGSGTAGNLTVKTGELTLADRSEIAASMLGEGSGGNVILEADRLALSDGSAISSASFGRGNAGNLTIASDELTLQDGSFINVSAVGNFSPGSLRVSADRVRLDNQSNLIAETEAGSQGNIEVSANSTILSRNSNIATNAIAEATGGNIEIDTGILAAVGNSDISANSAQAQGGNVTLNVRGIFGTAFRPQNTAASDITATGANSSLSGTVTINTPDIDPTSGLVELPDNFVDASNQIDSSCRPGQQQSEFVVTGRGGLPPNPIEAIADEATWIDLRPTAREPQDRGQLGDRPLAASTERSPSVEAQGWTVKANGQVELVAESPENTSPHPSTPQRRCLETR